MKSRPRVVIVGGGISGLATAHFIRRRLGADVQLTLVEEGPRLGGKVATQEFSGHQVDTGPDALLVRSPKMAALLEDLGLAGQTVAPGAQGAHVWSRGRLRRLPQGTLFGVPDRLIPLLRSRLLSPLGLVRAAMDLVLPRSRSTSHDPSIADLVCPRLGSQVFDRLVEPLLGGVHAGRAGQLSARSTVPDIDALARNNRSLYLGLRRLRRRAKRASGAVVSGAPASGAPASGAPASGAPASGAPALVTLEGGLVRLVDALAAGLGDTDIRLDSAAAVVSAVDGCYRVDLVDGHSIEADSVILATPAFVTARLLADAAPKAATILAEALYADVATIWLAYPNSALLHHLDGTGFLVPPEEGKLLVGCTWSSAKWPHLADDDVVLIRCMVGRHGDRRWVGMDDDTLVGKVHDELVEAMGLTAGPVHHRVQRWPRALPQYLVGHQDRLDAVDAALTRLPGLHLTGAAYRGVGLASCVADAERTATDVAQDVFPTQAGIRPLTEVAS